MSQPEPCRHHYLIGELADLPRDQGRCKLCGTVRTFPLVVLDMGYTEWRVQRPHYLASEREIVGYIADRMREG